MRNPIRRWIIARAIRVTIRQCRIDARRQRQDEGLVISAPGDTATRVIEALREVRADTIKRVAPGRQPIQMAMHTGFGLMLWSPIPPDAKQAPYEDLHTFPKGGRPRRDAVGFHMPYPALSMVCVGCELEQPPLTGGERACPYCGLRLRLHGTHVFWWREPTEVAAWNPQTGA